MNAHHFWQWFLANETILRNIHSLSDKGREELLYWFSKHLEYYSPKIGYRFIIPPENQDLPTLAFSTCGDPEVGALILHLMESAPKNKDWIITAYITSLADQDPDYFEKEYCLNGICLKPSNIKFLALLIDPDTDQFILGIILDFPINKYDSDLLREIVGIILNDTLGEERFKHYIEDFIIKSQIPQDEELFELKDLKLFLEGL